VQPGAKLPRLRLLLVETRGFLSTCPTAPAEQDGSMIVAIATSQAKAKDKVMSKGQKSNKETKKMPAMTPKEKKAAKKAKKNEKGRIGE
jgi:hypothetical protein